MANFSYEPDDAEVAMLAKMVASDGWAVFRRIMQGCCNECGADAIDAMDTKDGRPPAYYKGYLDSLRETTVRIDAYVEGLKARMIEQNKAERTAPMFTRDGVSSGGTAS